MGHERVRGKGAGSARASARGSSGSGGTGGAGQPGKAQEGDTGLTGTAAQVSLVVTPTVIEASLPRLRRVIAERLVPKAAAGVQRALLRTMVPRLTQQLVRSLVANMTVELVSRGGLADVLVNKVRDAVVPRLARQLTLAIARSLTAQPAAAHYCELCREQSMYCAECELDQERGRQIDARAVAAARYWTWRMGRAAQEASEELSDREGAAAVSRAGWRTTTGRLGEQDGG